ncbi:hypothetical protein ORJ66_08230 [Pseudoalteromonas tunicata]|uniref:hypothetical protein n=1 Tax=Pseudoalteromonas tunicata TaxID=314281 RepID=UPI00273DE2DD|nr:hypothetical protein [Pseudoalteromonas tunicata]MDP5213029.1 hypothetical protein [Pseudoalteromonas tunicata]
MAMVTQHKQQGVVLVAALVMIIAMTGIAVSLMSSSSLDLKMVNAAQESETAEMTIKGDAELSLRGAMNEKGASKLLWLNGQFGGVGVSQDITAQSANPDSKVVLFNENTGPTELDCPPQYAVTNGIKCNALRIQAEMKYGAQKKHIVVVHSGILQELGGAGQGQ